MVFVPACTVGWRPPALSWLQSLKLQPPPAGDDDAAATADQCEGPPQREAAGAETAKASPEGAEHMRSRSDAAAAAAAQPRQPALQPMQELIWALLGSWVDPLLAWIRANGKEALPNAECARVAAVSVLLGRLLETDGCGHVLCAAGRAQR
jgi:hypothetical protein